MASVPKPPAIDSLTGLRGLAAYAVVLCHANRAADGYLFPGQAWVDLFFALSGFVISYVYLGAFDLRRFFIARFSRIYPLYLASTVGVIALLLGQTWVKGEPFAPYVNLKEAVEQLFLLMALPGFTDGRIWNPPSWSISVEWWTYFLVFPLLVPLSRMIGERKGFILTMGALVISAVIVTVWDSPEPTLGWTAFLRAIVGFTGGWAAYRLYAAGMVPDWLSARTVTVLGVAVLVAIFGSWAAWEAHAWALIPVYPLLILGMAAREDSAFCRILSGRTAVFAGDISYSVYLLHSLVIAVLSFAFSQFLPGYTGGLLFYLSIFVGSTIVAIPSYYWLERPSQRLLRSAFSLRRPGVARRAAS